MSHRMRSFWNARARENALYFINNSLDYRGTDREAFWRSGETELETILAALDSTIAATATVLEVGCGIGRMTRALAERGATVIGLDISTEMLRMAAEQNPQLDNVEWLLGDGSSLAAVEDETIDVVFSHVVLQHIPDPVIVLAYITEMGRVLRTGGWALVGVSTDPAVHDRSIRLRDRARAVLRRGPSGQDDPAWRGCAVSIEAVEEAARRGGMVVARSIGEGSQFCFARCEKTVTMVSA